MKARKQAASRVKPESLAQVRTWDRVKARYLTAGLCHGCSAQAAWGHQCGFGLIDPPCGTCKPLVATLPDATTTTNWRRFQNPQVQ